MNESNWKPGLWCHGRLLHTRNRLLTKRLWFPRPSLLHGRIIGGQRDRLPQCSSDQSLGSCQLIVHWLSRGKGIAVFDFKIRHFWAFPLPPGVSAVAQFWLYRAAVLQLWFNSGRPSFDWPGAVYLVSTYIARPVEYTVESSRQTLAEYIAPLSRPRAYIACCCYLFPCMKESWFDCLSRDV